MALTPLDWFHYRDVVKFICNCPLKDGSPLDVNSLVSLSRANKKIRSFVLELLFGRLQIDRPHNLPEDQLGKFLNATVVNLRLFIRKPLRRTASEPDHFPALCQIPGFQPDPSNIILDVNKMTSIHIVALGSLELLDFCLQSQARDEKGLLELYQTACHLKHAGMVRKIFERFYGVLISNLYGLNDKKNSIALETYLATVATVINQPEALEALSKMLEQAREDRHICFMEKHEIDKGNHQLNTEICQLDNQPTPSPNERAKLVSKKKAIIWSDIPYDDAYHFLLKFLCLAYRNGDLSAKDHINPTESIERIIGNTLLKELYEKSHEKLFEAACESGSVEMIEHFFQKLGKPTTSNFTAAHLVTAHRLGCGQQMFNIMLLDYESRSEILNGAYATKDVAFIDFCRQQLDLSKVPDPMELSYACQTSYPAIVNYALARINRKKENCNVDAASKITCTSGNLTSLELLIKENLFFLSPAIDVPASLSSLFQKAEEQGQLAQLLALIETIPDQHKLYIISSDAFVKADESSKSPNYDQNQARIRSEQDLIRAIEAGNLETAKPLMPKDVIPSTIAQHVLACATKSSSQHLDILLHFMQNGLKLTDLSNDALSDLFLAASRHGHLEAAIALVRQVFEKRTIDPMEGSRCMQLLQDRQGAYLEAALLCGNPEMTRFIRTVAVHGDLGVNEFMKKFETNQPLEQSRWEKFNVKWTQIKLGFYEAVVIFWNILKSPFRLIFG